MNNVIKNFIETAKCFPDNIAIVADVNQITYKELLVMTYRCASFFLKKEYSNRVIVVIGEKRISTIAMILGIIMSGNIYLPIDSNYPTERIKYILKNSKADVVVSENLVSYMVENNYLFSDIFNTDIERDLLNCVDIKESSLCYLIYTSGSSANTPNGVMVWHKGIYNTVEWRINYYKICSKDVILLFASLSFDSSIEDIFSALLSGAKLVLVDDQKKLEPQYIRKVILENNVNYLMLVPSAYEFLIEYIYDAIGRCMKNIILAGEKVTQNLANKHFKVVPHVKLYNEYGPTENSVCSTCGRVHKNSEITIGKPISNVFFYLIDENGRINNEKGELCLYGEGVAAGYWRNRTLTDQKFKPNRVTGEGKVYHTGDYVKISLNNELIYIDRLDNQVKINGIRFELDEITDLCLKYHDSIRKAITVCCSKNEKNYIGVFFYAKNEIDIADLKKYLGKKLPNNIMPGCVYQIYELFYLPNGKIDIKRYQSLLEELL